MPNRDEGLVFPNSPELVLCAPCCPGRFLLWRFIDGSVIDTVGAGGFLRLIEGELVLYRLSVQGECGLRRA
jgi:hypothetical protein